MAHSNFTTLMTCTSMTWTYEHGKDGHQLWVGPRTIRDTIYWRKTKATTTTLERPYHVLNTRNFSSPGCSTRYELHGQWATLTCSSVRKNLKPIKIDSMVPGHLQRPRSPSHVLQSWTTPQVCTVSTRPVSPSRQVRASQSRRRVKSDHPCSVRSQRRRSPLNVNGLLRMCPAAPIKLLQAS